MAQQTVFNIIFLSQQFQYWSEKKRKRLQIVFNIKLYLISKAKNVLGLYQDRQDSLSKELHEFFCTHLWPFRKSKLNLMSDRINRVAPGSPLLSVCLIYPMFGRYSTNWDRKDWPGSEIQMYYGCPCLRQTQIV